MCAGFVLAAGVPATGQTDCFDGTALVACAQAVSPAMSYTKLGAAGNTLDAAAASWSCVRDNVTGLVWEVKTADGGLRDASHRYSWLSNEATRNGAQPGSTGDTQSCSASLGGQPCNTANLVAAVNAAGYCGASDWRMPTQAELLTLVHAGRLAPSIEPAIFINTPGAPYWSANTHAMYPLMAWGVHFGYGSSYAQGKHVANAVRLVRGTWGP